MPPTVRCDRPAERDLSPPLPSVVSIAAYQIPNVMARHMAKAEQAFQPSDDDIVDEPARELPAVLVTVPSDAASEVSTAPSPRPFEFISADREVSNAELPDVVAVADESEVSEAFVDADVAFAQAVRSNVTSDAPPAPVLSFPALRSECWQPRAEALLAALDSEIESVFQIAEAPPVADDAADPLSVATAEAVDETADSVEPNWQDDECVTPSGASDSVAPVVTSASRFPADDLWVVPTAQQDAQTASPLANLRVETSDAAMDADDREVVSSAAPPVAQVPDAEPKREAAPLTAELEALQSDLGRAVCPDAETVPADVTAAPPAEVQDADEDAGALAMADAIESALTEVAAASLPVVEDAGSVHTAESVDFQPAPGQSQQRPALELAPLKLEGEFATNPPPANAEITPLELDLSFAPPAVGAAQPELAPEQAAEPAAEPPVAEPDNRDDYAVFVAAVKDVALKVGETRMAAAAGQLLVEGRCDKAGFDESVIQALTENVICEEGSTYLTVTPAFREQLAAWQDVLDGSATDLSACGTTTLDGLATLLVCSLLGDVERAPKVKRQLRKRGVAAFGLAA